MSRNPVDNQVQALPKLTAREVELGYRLLLDRDPESSEVIDRHVSAYKNWKDFRDAVIVSKEKKKNNKTPVTSMYRPLNWPPIRVDVNVRSDQLEKMLHLVARNWQALGETEPYWSVLTNDAFKADKIAESRAQFYETGQSATDSFFVAAARCGVDISRLKSCFELGCGVGRVTGWLARRFPTVIGADISLPHINLAKEMAISQNVENIEFLHIETPEQLRNIPNFDVFYSLIVLQHNPPPVIYFILNTVLSKLSPGGVAYFQVPTYRLNYNFDVDVYLHNARVRGNMEMHVLPQHFIYLAIEKHNCRLLEMREDGMCGSEEFVSNSFLVTKND